MASKEWDSLSGLEQRTVITERELERLEALNAQLLEALEATHDALAHYVAEWNETPLAKQARAAIEKANPASSE